MWTTVQGAPTANARHDDVFFLDEKAGWIVNLDGEIHRTIDGGATWQTYTEAGGAFRSVVFVSPTVGWVGTLNTTRPLIATTDGGQTWSTVDLPEPTPHGICGLHAPSANVIYGSGIFAGPARVIVSRDAGSSWESIDLSPYAATLVDCYFASPDSGFVVGSSGRFGQGESGRPVVVATSDGGRTWERRFEANSDGLGWKISFPSRRVGYVSIEHADGDLARVLKTEDAGVSWIEISSPILSGRNVQGIGFVSESTGWLGGWLPFRSYRTNDGGVTWQVDDFGSNINSFQILSNGVGYAVGKSLYKYDTEVAVDRTTMSGIKSMFRQRDDGSNR